VIKKSPIGKIPIGREHTNATWYHLNSSKKRSVTVTLTSNVLTIVTDFSYLVCSKK